MKITLNLDNDYELQKFAKDLVRGQITSVIRDEIRNIIIEEITRKSKHINEPNMIILMKEEIRNVVTRYIRNDISYSSIVEDYVKPTVQKEWDKYLKTIDIQRTIQLEAKNYLMNIIHKLDIDSNEKE